MDTFWRHWFAAAALAAATLPAFAQAGVSDNRILIGQTVGLTGIVAGPVKEFNQGVDAYLKQVNAQGGVHGRRIEMTLLDDKFDPALTLKNAEQLIRKEGVFMLFGGRGTPHTTRILPLLAEQKVPLLAPTTGAKVFHEPVHPMVFNVKAMYQDEVAKAVEHFATVGITSISLLYVDDAFGKDGLEGFTKAMAARKLEPTAITSFARVDPDYAAAARAVIRPDPGALIVVSSAKNTASAIKAIRAEGGRMQIMTLSNNSSESFLEDLGPAGVGVILSQITPAPHLASTPLGQEFQELAKREGVTVSYSAMEGFVNAKVLVEGLRRAGRKLTREGFVHALESMQRVDFGGIMVTYGPNDHSGSEFVELTMIGKNGRIIR
ncbi:MAG TPA: ABC transporter substrate-binding protein [Noviherbaspirillum sp.]